MRLTRLHPQRISSSCPALRRLLSHQCTLRTNDARVRQIENDYASIRSHYATPQYPIILAHGLLGFSQLSLPLLPPIHYWHGIQEALTAQGARVVTSTVPPSSSIALRAARLADALPPDKVNIVAHSMGGLDARLVAATLGAQRVASVTTVSTPHRGSPFADYLLQDNRWYVPRVYRMLERCGLGTEAFAQLTTRHMREFNTQVEDVQGVAYFSYGAVMDDPPLLSPFRLPKRVIDGVEGQNDGLVSVESSKWGVYQGTLVGVNHLDLINWPNKVRWVVKGWMGIERRFNAVAFYLSLADMLAKEGF